MPVFTDKRAVGIGATVQNIMVGDKFEFLPIPAAVMVYMVQDTADVTLNVALDFTLGNVVVGDNLPLPFEGAGDLAGTGPDRNKHLVASGVGAPGDRIQLRLVNRDGVVAHEVRTLVDIRPL